MGRQKRPYLPGGIFHLTARTIRREHLLTPELRTAALQILADVLPRSQSRLLAAAVMSNHLHVLVQQGERPLSSLMQPLLRRLAIRLQQAHALDGPIFWRHYADRPCRNPTHVRNAIVYAHLNPVRARICRLPSEYSWTSHALYAADSSAPLTPEQELLGTVLNPHLCLPLFATERGASITRLHRDYRAFASWRLRTDERASAGGSEAPVEMPMVAGAVWAEAEGDAWLTPVFHEPVVPPSNGGAATVPSRLDLAALARRTLQTEAPGLDLGTIRGRGGKREYTRLRRLLIRRLHAAGYRNIQIARFLDLSESTISAAIRNQSLAL